MLNPRNITILLLLIATFFVGYFGALGKWNESGERGITLTQVEAQLRVAKADVDHGRQLISFYEELSDNDRSRVIRALPEKTDLPNLLVSIDRIAKESGIVLSNLSIEDREGPTGFAQDTEDTGPPASILSFSARGAYTSAKEFMRSLEVFLRVIDVETILLSSLADSGGSTDPLLEITLTAKTYKLEDTF